MLAVRDSLITKHTMLLFIYVLYYYRYIGTLVFICKAIVG